MSEEQIKESNDSEILENNIQEEESIPEYFLKREEILQQLGIKSRADLSKMNPRELKKVHDKLRKVIYHKQKEIKKQKKFLNDKQEDIFTDLKQTYNVKISPNDKIEKASFYDISLGSEKIIEICKKMIAPLDIYNGVAMCANQIGENIQVMVIRDIENQFNLNNLKKFACIINPNIIQQYGKTYFNEGCFSTKTNKKVKRYAHIEIEYFDENLMKHQKLFKQETACYIQHCLDMFNGIILDKK